MDKSNLDKLIRMYREGYISRDELIAHSKKAILKKDKSNHNRKISRPSPANKRPPVSAPIQAIIDLDTPPTMPEKIVVPTSSSGITLWNSSRGNPILAPMLGGALIAMAILAVVIIAIDDTPTQVATVTTETPKIANDASLKANTSASNQSISQLQKIASDFEKSSHWSKKELKQFQTLWLTLSDEQKVSLKNTHWFKTFSLILAIQLSQIHSLSAENTSNTSLRKELESLRQFSSALGNSVAAFEDPVIKTQRHIRISDMDLSPQPTPSKSPAPAKAQKKTSATKPIITPEISRLPELEKLLSEYVGYYESGNLDHIVKLFNGSGWHQGQIGDYELRESFKETFNKTIQRKMLIENLSWTFKGSTALATGKLTLLYTDRDKQEQHEQHGSIRLVATLHNNEFRFSNLYHILE